MNADTILAYGYVLPRQLPTGEWVALNRFLFTTGLLVGIDEVGYRTRFCYEHFADAAQAIATWDGAGDPPGAWIKEKGGGLDRAGPGLRKFREIPIRSETVP